MSREPAIPPTREAHAPGRAQRDHRLIQDRGADGWDEDLVLEALRDWVERFGGPPQLIDWNPALARRAGRADLAERFELEQPRYPPSYRARQLFGSWNAALAAAGQPTTQSGLKRSSSRARARPAGEPGHIHAWTLDEALLALRAHHCQHGEPPRFEDWVEADEAGARPTAATVQALAGSWNAAIELAGLPLRRTGSGRSVDPALREQAVARYLSGEPTTRIGQDLGVAASAVGRWVRDAGHSMRTRGPRGPYRRK